MSEPMLAGKRLDALVAVHVMGWVPWLEKRGQYEIDVHWQRTGEREPWTMYRGERPERYRRLTLDELLENLNKYEVHLTYQEWFSTTGDGMLLLLARMTELGWWAQLNTPFTAGDQPDAGFTPLGTTGWNGRPDHRSKGDTLPHAVALAALAVIPAPRVEESTP